MKMNREDYIRSFHKAFNLDVGSDPSLNLLKLRKTLIDEEIDELFADINQAIECLESGNEIPKELFINMLKELADVQVVLSGMSVAIKPLNRLEEAFDRVHQSNMSKLGDDGKPIFRDDGKVLKGPNYTKPDLSDLI